GFVQHMAQIGVDRIAGDESFVKGAVADQIAEVGLRQRGAGIAEILHFELRFHRVDDFVVDHSVDFDGDIVLGDQLLRRHADDLLAHVHSDDAVSDRHDDGQPGLRDSVKLTQPHDDALFVLIYDTRRAHDHEQGKKQNRDQKDGKKKCNLTVHGWIY